MNEPDSAFEILRREWREAAPDLARWAWTSLVNRKDVWGQYTRMSEKERLNNKRGYKALTLPQPSMRGKDMVSLEKLERHFRSTAPHHLIGLHCVAANETSRWLAIDVDLHDPEAHDAEVCAARNFAAVTSWWEKLRTLEYDPILADSNGLGGYHIWVLFAKPQPTREVHAFGEHIVADWADHNLSEEPELFPRRPELGKDKLGPWLRLFGLHHTHPHFTRVWTGDDWLDDPWVSGSAAIEILLATRPGRSPGLPGDDAEEQDDKPKAKKKTGTKRRSSQNTKSKGVICVDLDGVVASYDGWKGPDHFGDPIPGARGFLESLAALGKVIIYSARCRGRQAAAAKKKVRRWLEEHHLAFDDIYTGVGKPTADAYIDDRAVACRPQTGGRGDYETALLEARRLAEQIETELQAESGALWEQLRANWTNLDPATQKKIVRLADKEKEIEK